MLTDGQMESNASPSILSVSRDAVQMPLGAAQPIFDYWQSICGDQFAPAWGSDFRLDELDIKLLPEISVVDVVNGGETYKYRYWGTRHARVKGFEMTGKFIDDGPSELVKSFGYHQFGEILRERRPLTFVYRVEYPGKIHSDHFTLRVPISDDGNNVTKIVSYQDLHTNRKDWEVLFMNFTRCLESNSPGSFF